MCFGTPYPGQPGLGRLHLPHPFGKIIGLCLHRPVFVDALFDPVEPSFVDGVPLPLFLDQLFGHQPGLMPFGTFLRLKPGQEAFFFLAQLVNPGARQGSKKFVSQLPDFFKPLTGEDELLHQPSPLTLKHTIHKTCVPCLVGQ